MRMVVELEGVVVVVAEEMLDCSMPLQRLPLDREIERMDSDWQLLRLRVE